MQVLALNGSRRCEPFEHVLCNPFRVVCFDLHLTQGIPTSRETLGFDVKHLRGWDLVCNAFGVGIATTRYRARLKQPMNCQAGKPELQENASLARRQTLEATLDDAASYPNLTASGDCPCIDSPGL